MSYDLTVLSHNGIVLLMLPLTCKGLAGIDSLFRCVSTLWLDVAIRMLVVIGYMLDIPQKYSLNVLFI